MIVVLLLIVLGVWTFLLRQPSPVWAASWDIGDVVVGTGFAYNVYSHNGVFKETLTDGFGERVFGCAFNLNGDLYTTSLDNKVVKFSGVHPHTILLFRDTFGQAGDRAPTSLVFGASGSFYVGFSSGSSGLAGIQKYSATDAFQQRYSVAVGRIGSDYIDLAADQQTMFYTSDSPEIKRYNVATSSQLPDFVASIGKPYLYGLRLLPGGGLLVASGDEILRLNNAGTVVQTYDATDEDSWIALSLDSSSTSFWAGGYLTGKFYRFNINTGAVELGPISAGYQVSGLCVKGELTTAQPTATATRTPTPTPTNTPTPTCAIPTPFPYPWACVPSPTATAAGAPREVRSYYVLPTNTPIPATTATPTATPLGWKGHWYQLGRDEALRAINSGDGGQRLAVLNFGRPYVIPHTSAPPEWGTLLLLRGVLPFISIQDIKEVATDFATGFYDTSITDTPPTWSSPPRIIVAIGTTNYWMPNDSLSPLNFYHHGRQWGTMINELSLKYIKWRPIVEFEGANDIEFAWSTPDRALLWAQGFEDVTRNDDSDIGRRHYYVYGSCDDCAWPPANRPNDLIRRNYHPETPVPGPTYTPIPWHMDEIIGMVSANDAARTLPQIYWEDPTATPIADRRDQPAQWMWLSSYADTHSLCLDVYGIRRGISGKIVFSGVMANPPGSPCCLPPDVAFKRFQQAISGSNCTYFPPVFMQFLTPIYDSPR